MTTYAEAAEQVAPHIDRMVEEKIAPTLASLSKQGLPDEWIETVAHECRQHLKPWRDAAVAQAARALTHPEAPTAALQ